MKGKPHMKRSFFVGYNGAKAGDRAWRETRRGLCARPYAATHCKSVVERGSVDQNNNPRLRLNCEDGGSLSVVYIPRT